MTRSVSQARQPVTNLIKNYNFENVPTFTAAQTTAGAWIDGTVGGTSLTDGVYGWGFTSKTGTGSVQYDTSVYKTGTASMKLSLQAVSSNIEVFVTKNASNASIIKNAIPVTPGLSYTYSGWIKTLITSGAATTGARLFVNLYSGDGAYATTVAISGNTQSTQDWTFSSASFTPGGTVRFASPGCSFRGNDGTATLIGDAWFDDLRLDLTINSTRTAITGPYRQPIDNLVKNGNFEYAPAFTAATTAGNVWIDGTASGSATNDVYGWGTVITVNGSASFDTSVKYSGSASIKLSCINATGQVTVGPSALLATPAFSNSKPIPVLPNTSYTLTALVKTNNVAANSAFIDMREYTSALAIVTTTSSTKLSGTNDWTLLTCTATTGATTRFIMPILRNNVAGNISDAWFDNIKLDLTSGTTRTVVT